MNNVGKSARTVNTYWIHTNNSDIVGISASALEHSGTQFEKAARRRHFSARHGGL
ncbi:MAG: hypothetical protein AB7U63_09565 [Porticoccaceae bacterium]